MTESADRDRDTPTLVHDIPALSTAEPATNSWNWFSVFNPATKVQTPTSPKSATVTNANGNGNGKEAATMSSGRVSSVASTHSEFEVLEEGDRGSNHSSIPSHQEFYDQEQGAIQIRDDYKNSNNDIASEAVMISQTLTLKSRNEELERERDELHSETLQLKIQTECLQQTNDHIIAAQQQEIEDLRTALHDKDEQLKQVQAELAHVQRDKESLNRKINELLQAQNRSASQSTDLANTEVLMVQKPVIYGCSQCAQHLFDSSAMVQRQIEIDDVSTGCVVEALFNGNEVTMGPALCKTFLNGVFRVKEVFCSGCLASFGWKIVESFDEWNVRFENKFCVDTAAITEIS